MADREKLIALLDEVHHKHLGKEYKERLGTIADYLIENGVTFYAHKTENSMCLYCNSSMSGDAPDGSQVLVCFDCAGHEGKEMIVGDDEYCTNYNGIV